MTPPDRFLHLRHPDGFSDERFTLFVSHCRIWQAYVCAVLAEWHTIEPSHGRAPAYLFFDPSRSSDGLQVTLPVGGDQTLASRATFEDAASHLLSDFFPFEFKLGLEEGLTETTRPNGGLETSWRQALRTVK